MSILIDADSTFIIQGITGREAVTMTRELLDYGSKVVGGVTPGRKGREVHGVPVEDTVRAFTEREQIDGAIVAVPPAFATDAILEAVEAGVKLIVVVTERIPRAEVARAVEYAAQEGARIIGPNCLGLIAPGKSKMGGIGGAADATQRAFQPGVIGVMSRSGGMTTEISNALSEAGLGVSTAISIGGDAIIGSTYAELMPLFEADEQTQGLAIYSEPGGPMEAQLAEHIAEHGSRLPVVAFMAGRFMDEMPGMRFGHAGTIVEGRADTTADKIARLEAAGIAVAERIEEIPALLRERHRGVERERGVAMAMFIRVDIDESVQQDADLRSRLAEVCPVDIFTIDGEGDAARVETVEANLDECTLCDLCIDVAGDAVRVVKLYEE